MWSSREKIHIYAQPPGQYRKEREKTSFELLIDRVNANVKEGLGMSNQLVDKLCRREASNIFKGVYSADKIPGALAFCPRFIIVVNLGTSAQQMGHFVTVCGHPDKIKYIDSFALTCTQPNVRSFLQACRRPLVTLTRRIQGWSSMYCGLYAMLFTLYDDKNPDFDLIFSFSKFDDNDAKCVRYIRKLIHDYDE